jgi:hypothetical protein
MDENPYKSPATEGTHPDKPAPSFGGFIRSLTRIVLALFGVLSLFATMGFAVAFTQVAAAANYLGFAAIALTIAVTCFAAAVHIPR